MYPLPFVVIIINVNLNGLILFTVWMSSFVEGQSWTDHFQTYRCANISSDKPACSYCEQWCEQKYCCGALPTMTFFHCLATVAQWGKSDMKWISRISVSLQRWLCVTVPSLYTRHGEEETEMAKCNTLDFKLWIGKWRRRNLEHL